MKAKKFKVEVVKGKRLPLTRDNILIKDETDMENVEFWEDQLDKLGQAYTVAFREKKGQIVYTIFTKMRGRGSAFK